MHPWLVYSGWPRSHTEQKKSNQRPRRHNQSGNQVLKPQLQFQHPCCSKPVYLLRRMSWEVGLNHVYMQACLTNCARTVTKRLHVSGTRIAGSRRNLRPAACPLGKAPAVPAPRRPPIPCFCASGYMATVPLRSLVRSVGRDRGLPTSLCPVSVLRARNPGARGYCRRTRGRLLGIDLDSICRLF